MKEIIRQDLDSYNLEDQAEKKDKKYLPSGTTADSPLTYNEAKGMVESFFYGQQNPYKPKKHEYERGAGYKK